MLRSRKTMRHFGLPVLALCGSLFAPGAAKGQIVDIAERPEDRPVVDPVLSCRVVSAGVQLNWNIAFFAPIRGFLVVRDDERIASLPASASSFLDAQGKEVARSSALSPEIEAALESLLDARERRGRKP